MPQANHQTDSTEEQPVRLRLLPTAHPAPVQDDAPPTAARRAHERLERFDAAIQHWLIAHSITLLRLSLGVIFLAFGALKFFPDISPAQNLVETTTNILTFGLVPGPVALVAIATLECVIGLCLLTGRALRGAIYLLAIQLIGILSPLVLLAPRMFSGPHHAPTLEGQYVLKDIILLAATLLLATTLRGAKLTTNPNPRS